MLSNLPKRSIDTAVCWRTVKKVESKNTNAKNILGCYTAQRYKLISKLANLLFFN